MKQPIILPLSKAPVCESAGLFLGTLAFPTNQKKRDEFVWAWCREAVRSTAIKDREFAWTPQFLKPGYFIMSDSRADEILKEGERNLHKRKLAFLATQAYFAEALTGMKIDRIVFKGLSEPLTIESCFRFVNIFRNKSDGASVKNPRRDYLYPSKGVLHVAQALYSNINWLCEQGCARTEPDAFELLFADKGILAELVSQVEVWRAAVLRHDRLMEMTQASEAELVQFVIG